MSRLGSLGHSRRSIVATAAAQMLFKLVAPTKRTKADMEDAEICPCNYCDKVFDRPGPLELHIKGYHSDVINPITPKHKSTLSFMSPLKETSSGAMKRRTSMDILSNRGENHGATDFYKGWKNRDREHQDELKEKLKMIEEHKFQEKQKVQKVPVPISTVTSESESDDEGSMFITLQPKKAPVSQLQKKKTEDESAPKDYTIEAPRPADPDQPIKKFTDWNFPASVKSLLDPKNNNGGID